MLQGNLMAGGRIGMLIVPGLLLLLAVSDYGRLFDWVGGNFAGSPQQLQTSLSPGAKELLERAFAHIDPELLADFHIHMIGRQGDGTGSTINPSADSWLHPIRRAQLRVYLSAAGVKDSERLGPQYVERLLALIHAQPGPGHFFLYAMDRHYRPDGSVDEAATPFHVPNRYVFGLAEQYPDIFVPVVSIHPYRSDALATLDHWADKGVRFVKWLPNAMGIDPTDERLVPFYRRMTLRKMVLLVHTGRELAVYTGGRQDLGNPLRLRKPLDLGVTVVALHFASDGKDRDLDDPAQPLVPSFELLLRLMDEPRYQHRLFGEISAITFFNHLGAPLELLLSRPDLHPRLVNGSDYPLPGINLLIMTGRLARLGFISEQERGYLNEIYRYNPLLFDFVVKRTVRHPRTGQQFSPLVFMLPDALLP
jgi:mannonate dehydratase